MPGLKPFTYFAFGCILLVDYHHPGTISFFGRSYRDAAMDYS